MKHVYGKKISVKAFYLVCLGLALFYAHFAWSKPPDAPSRPMELAIAAGLLLPALGFVVYGFTVYIAISDDSVETGSIFGKQYLRLHQISHRREYQKEAGDDYILRYIEFIPTDPRERALKIVTDHFAFDTEFRRFVERFPEANQPHTRASHSSR